MPLNELPIRDTEQLGAFVRAIRKAQRLRQDEVGQFSHSFIVDLEGGKPTAQIGKVLGVLSELGARLWLELPADLDREQFDRYIHDPRSSKDESR